MSSGRRKRVLIYISSYTFLFSVSVPLSAEIRRREGRLTILLVTPFEKRLGVGE